MKWRVTAVKGNEELDLGEHEFEEAETIGKGLEAAGYKVTLAQEG